MGAQTPFRPTKFPPPGFSAALLEHPAPYYQAARFPNERKAGRAYFRLQAAIFQTDCDLSAYRFLLDRISHVAVLGAPPPEELDAAIRRLLSTGQPVSLPDEVLTVLLQRRAEQTRLVLQRHVFR